MSQPNEFASDPAALIPPTGELRTRLAKALQDVKMLRGLLRLSESVTRRPAVTTAGRIETAQTGQSR